jgi:hypothetical protein
MSSAKYKSFVYLYVSSHFMNTPQIQKTKKSYFTWLYQIFILLFGLLMAIIGVTEYYNVTVGGQESAYAFGASDNADDWLYKTASNYSKYMLLFGISSLSISFFGVWSFLKRKEIILSICLSLIVFIFIIDRLFI